MSKMVKKILYYVFTFLQVATIIGIKIVHSLSSKKAGLNHHLWFYKSKYSIEIFNNSNIFTFKVIIGIMIVLLFIALIYFMYKKKNNKPLINLIISILCCILLLWILTSTSAISLLIYPFIVFDIVLVLVIEIIKIFIMI